MRQRVTEDDCRHLLFLKNIERTKKIRVRSVSRSVGCVDKSQNKIVISVKAFQGQYQMMKFSPQLTTIEEIY